jgi:hypothetical protein
MPAALLGIVWGQKDLRDGYAVASERFLIRMCEADLPGRCRGLLFFEPQPPAGEAEVSSANRDRSGGDKDHLLPSGTTAGDVVGQGVEPLAVDLAAFGSQQC